MGNTLRVDEGSWTCARDYEGIKGTDSRWGRARRTRGNVMRRAVSTASRCVDGRGSVGGGLDARRARRKTARRRRGEGDARREGGERAFRFRVRGRWKCW